MEAKVYNSKGAESGKVNLPESVFGARWNSDLVHQVVHGMLANAREGRAKAHAKDRSEVSGGGKKPWRQKGTGRARHGSNRSPIWVGGGVTHGPRKEKNYEKKINKKMRTQALYAVLSKKFKDGEVIFVDTLVFDAPKTSEAKTILNALAKGTGNETLATKKNNAALIALGEAEQTATKKSFRNIGMVKAGSLKNLNPVDALAYTYLIITNPKESVEFLASRGA